MTVNEAKKILLAANLSPLEKKTRCMSCWKRLIIKTCPTKNGAMSQVTKDFIKSATADELRAFRRTK